MKQKRYWLRGIFFGVIAGIIIILLAILLRVGGLREVAYYPWIFSYTIFVGLVTFSIAGVVIKKRWTSIVKGLAIGLIAYVVLVVPVMIPEFYLCFSSSSSMCGIFSATALLTFLPVILLAPIVGLVYGKIKNRSSSVRLY